MTQTKKLILSLVLGFLILVNLAVLVYAAIPLAKAYQGNATRLGLKLTAEPNTNISAADIDEAIAVIKSRLKGLGVSSATVELSQVEGEHIAVLIPAGNDLNRIKEAITYDGLLELIPLVKDTQIFFKTKETAEKVAKDFGNTEFEILNYRVSDSGNMNDERWVVVEKTPLITGADFREARAIKSQYSDNNYEISFTLNPEGAKRLSDWTGENMGSILAIVLNHEVKSAPRIQSRIFDQGQISGSFTKRSAETLAIALTSGKLPHPVEIVSEQAVSSHGAMQGQKMKLGGLVLSLLVLIGGLVFILTR